MPQDFAKEKRQTSFCPTRRSSIISMLVLASLSTATNALNPERVHLLSWYPERNPTNFLFRGNNPTAVDAASLQGRSFNFSALIATLQQKAQSECAQTLPENFLFHDLNLENPTDPGFFAEAIYWKLHEKSGMLGTPRAPGVWTTLGSIEEPQRMPEAQRKARVANGSWAVGNHADHLAARLNATRSLLEDTSGPPRILYVHCNAGCDRTGEFIASYAMQYLQYNVTTAYAEGCKQCGRCPNFYATNAIAWWCLTLESQRLASPPGLGNCLDFASCKFLGDCTAKGGTPRAGDCPERDDWTVEQTDQVEV